MDNEQVAGSKKARSADSLLRLVKANDLDDDLIHRLWVPFGPHPDRLPFFDPTSSMATVILGGKGSGKTHLMRYHSFSVQALKYQDSPGGLASIVESGYLAVYIKASGLNGSRFRGKAISDEAWTDAFAYYTELWLAQRFLSVLIRLYDHVPELRAREAAIVRSFNACFDKTPEAADASLSSLAAHLRSLQHQLDIAINETAFTGSFSPDIRCSRGRLLFGFPIVVQQAVPAFRDLVISYYMDEYENLYAYQQRYFNTLLREREAPVTIRIGARSYGMRTFDTLSAGEDIREGSEYELLRLDSYFREDADHYNQFARTLLLRRIEDWAGPEAIQELESSFQIIHDNETTRVPTASSTKDGSLRPHLTRLRKRLCRFLPTEDVDEIISCLQCVGSPLVEKGAVYLFYQGFSRGETDLVGLARRVSEHRRSMPVQPNNRLNKTLEHRRNDFRAQLARESRKPAPLATDLDSLIWMSEGLPRVFLTTMKHILSWSEFEEGGLSTNSVSTYARRQGLLDAAEWFQKDMPQVGAAGEVIVSCIARLGELFRISRYSDKPIECSLIAFSTPLSGLSQTAVNNIQECENRSFIIRVRRGERDRNSRQVRPKYHLNRVLCPLFDLPVARRGTARLDAWEVDTIFGITRSEDYAELKRRWNRRLNWPFRRSPTGDEFDDNQARMSFLGVE